MFADLVVLVPGITGSVLTKEGRHVWSADRMGFLRMLSEGLAELSRPEGASEDWDDGVEATGLMPTAHLIPGVWKIDGYTAIGRHLRSSLDLRQGQYHEFAYDWRRDNRLSALKLERFVGERLGAWRRESGKADARVVFVVHSMGGLVARHHIECLGGWRSTRALVSYGTPYRGSVDALGCLANGYAKAVGPLVVDATAPIRSFTSMYQLMPTYACVVGSGPGALRVTELDIPNVDRARCADAMAFHAEIRDGQAANAREDAYRVDGPKVRPVVGLEQPTSQSAKVSGGAVTLLRSIDGSRERAGDGTVPRFSAIPLEMDAGAGMFVPTAHSSLQSDVAALAHASGLLKDSLGGEARFRADGEGIRIGLDLDGSYQAGTPFEIEAVSDGHRQSLDVEIVGPSGAPVRGKLRSDGRAFKGTFSLPEGLHRLTVSGQGVRPASDILAVFDGGA